MKQQRIKAWGGYCPKLGLEGVKHSDDPAGERALYAVFKTRRQARTYYECVRPVWILDNLPPVRDGANS